MAKYLKQDTDLGYVEDSAEIEYLKFNNLRHSILGYMWGDFNSEGEYVISPEIQRELIAMPKYVVDTIDNIDICLSTIKFDKQITFMVTMEGDRATLSLVEKVNFEANNKLNSGTYSNINEYILDEVETSGVIDKNALYRRWNIVLVPGQILDIFHMDEETLAVYIGLVNRFKYLIKSNEILLKNEEKIEEIEAGYFVGLLNIVDHYPKLKEVVDQELSKTIEEKKEFVRIDRPNFAKTINEIIEKAIDNNINLLTETEQKEFQAEKHNIQVEHNIKIQDAIDYKTETIEINEEHVGNEITAEKKDKIVLETFNEEKNQTILELAQNNLKSEKEVIERNAEEAVALNSGVHKRENKTADQQAGKVSAKEQGISKLIEDVLGGSIGLTQVKVGQNNQNAPISNRGKMINALLSRNVDVRKNIGEQTAKVIKENQPNVSQVKEENKAAVLDSSQEAKAPVKKPSASTKAKKPQQKKAVKKSDTNAAKAQTQQGKGRQTKVPARREEGLVARAFKEKAQEVSSNSQEEGTLASRYAQGLIDKKRVKQKDEIENIEQADTLLTSNKMNNLRGRQTHEVVKTKTQATSGLNTDTKLNTNPEDTLYEENEDDKILSPTNE